RAFLVPGFLRFSPNVVISCELVGGVGHRAGPCGKNLEEARWDRASGRVFWDPSCQSPLRGHEQSSRNRCRQSSAFVEPRIERKGAKASGLPDPGGKQARAFGKGRGR